MDEFSEENPSLEKIIEDLQEEKTKKVKTFAKKFTVDSLPQFIGGTALGIIPDYLAGLTWVGVLASRLIALPTNYFIGGIYGWCREKIFKYTGTNTESSTLRKCAAEMLCYETAQLPLYSYVFS